jgi:hypothetical protein
MVNKGLKASITAISMILFISAAAASTNSVDTITYESNSEFFDGQVLQIGYTSNFATDDINVYLDQGEIESEANVKADDPISFSVSHQETYAKYPTQDTDLNKIYGWDAVSNTVSSKNELWDWVTTNCADVDDAGETSVDGYGTTDADARANKWWDWTSASYKYDIYCWKRNGNYGSVADIGSPDEIFRTEWELQSGGKNPQTTVITNGDGGSGRTSNLGRYAKITWEGSLSTGENPPLVDDELALQSNTYENGWRVISERQYDNYRDYVQNNAYDLLGEWGAGRTTESSIESDMNAKAEQAASKFDQSSLSDSEVLGSSIQDGAFKVDMDRSLAYPEFNVYVDAGENGYATISKPVGKPEIVDTEGAGFGELGQGTISVEAENVGSAEGSFSGRIGSCGDFFSGNSLQNTQTVAPGESATFDFKVSFTSTSLTQSEFSDQCEVIIQDTGSGEEVSTEVSVTATQENECTEGDETKRQQDVNGEQVDVIYSCTNGLNLEQDEACSTDEEARYINDDVQWECRDKSSSPGTGGGSGLTVPGLGWGVENPASGFGSILDGSAGALTYAQILLSFIGFLAGFALLGVKLGAMIDGLATEFIPVGDSIVRLVLGLIGGLLSFMTVYQFVNDPIGFLLTVVGLVGLGYLYISGSTPDINL